jgi:hypothetical protein
MTSIRKLASALCWVTCSLSFSVSAQQIDTSGNLINNNNWSGVTYGVDPNDCCTSISGAGPLYDTSTDTIMFSYGQATVGQTIGINQALGGTGIQVHGYNYSWDFRYITNNTTQNDSLYFTVETRNSSGTIVESQVYNYDTVMNSGLFPYDTWITSSDTYTFGNPYLDPQSIKLTITGRDGGFWAGYYGPEVRNVSLSVNYTFDPCAADPLYSSSCPGYLDAYMANLFSLLGWGSSPEPEVEVASVDYSLMPSATISIPEETTTGEIKVDAGGIEVTSTGELQVPDGIPEEVREKKPVDMNLIMSIVREATDDSKALSVVNQSIEQSMAEDANPDFSMTNETLASISRQTENSIQQSILENLEVNQASVSSSSVSQITPDVHNVTYDDTNMTQNITSEFQTETKIDTSELQNQSLPKVTNEDKKETTQTVKKNIQDNEAAGEVSIDSLAQEPIDFNSYLNQQLKDMAFYLPKEIYKGQKNVDNARLLRGLTGGSDRLHQQMIEQQYR